MIILGRLHRWTLLSIKSVRIGDYLSVPTQGQSKPNLLRLDGQDPQRRSCCVEAGSNLMVEDDSFPRAKFSVT